jgi:hypothetical protein
LWLGAWRRAGKSLQRRGPSLLLTDAAFVDGTRCPILYRYRGIKDVPIAFSSLQQHSTHPLAHHPPTNSHTCRHKLEQSSNQPCAITSARSSSCPATVARARPRSLHIHFPSRSGPHSWSWQYPSYPATLNCHSTSMCTGACASGAYSRFFRGCIC